MLTFTEFCKREMNRKRIYESVYNKVILECKRFKEQLQNDIKKGKKILLEDVQSMFDQDLHQTEQDAESMKSFVNQYNRLSSEDKIKLVDQLSKPLPGNNYITNNNEIKLILIYKNDPDSTAGNKAYQTIILNKQKWFEVIARKAAVSGKIPQNQVSDYAQEMVLTLIGGGNYNDKNGSKFSLDAYDPYSGVPFNSFVNTYIVNSSGNKFNAKFNTSIATDYTGSNSEKMNVVSTDTQVNDPSDGDKQVSLLDTIMDTSSTGASPDELMTDDEQKKLLEKYLNNPALNENEKQAIKLRYGLNTDNGEQMTLLDIGLKLGYPKASAIQNARRILGIAQSKLKQFAKQNFK